LDVVFKIKGKHGLVPPDIAGIQVQCIPEMIQMVGKTTLPKTRLEAQLSLPYSIAVAMVTGRAFLAEYEPPFINDREVKRIMELVEIISNPDLPFDSEPYVTITTHDGRCFKGHVAYASGAPQNPLAPQAIIQKFEALAARVLTPDRVQALKEGILHIATIDDVRRITRYLPSAPTHPL
jgi:2-methylcitrate dehydratase PrpD